MHPTQSQVVLGVGVTIGLALPPLIRCLKKLIRTTSSPSNDDSDNDQTTTKTDTNIVRSGLSDSKSAIRLPRSKLEQFLSQILVKAGASPSHADLVASVLTYADSRGIPSHGANRADTYANELTAGVVDGKAIPIVEHKSGCCAVINGKNGLGAVTSDLAINTAISLAKEHGVGFVVCRMSNHFGAAGYWAQRALDVDMMGMSFTNTSPFVVPTGGSSRAVGTNPFCFFAPVRGGNGSGDGKDKLSRGESFQLDMATSVVPVGKVEVMHRLGKSCPEGWGVDCEGTGTTDAEEICRRGGLYPLGGSEETAGYKGYGLAMFVEILCSVLSGAAIGPSVQPWLASREGHIDFGHCFIVIDPARFTSGFDERLGSYIETMRSLPGNVKVPGDPERVFEDDADKSGVIVHKPVAATLKTLAKRFGVETPSVFETVDISTSKESLYAK